MADQPQDELLLHQRLLGGTDPTATEEAASRYLPLIEKHVAVRAWNIYHTNDRELIWDASVDAVFDYVRNPQKFDPSKSSVLGYLKRAAERDLINAFKKYRRQRTGEELSDNVEEFIRSRNKRSEISGIVRDAEAQMISSIQRERDLETISNVGNERDEELLRLIRSGERGSDRFAAVLGIENLPAVEKRRIVKQHKDRLKVQLKRERSKRRD